MGSSTELIVQHIEYVPAQDKRQMLLDLLQTLAEVSALHAPFPCPLSSQVFPCMSLPFVFSSCSHFFLS